MPFQPGNTLASGGAREGAGRPKSKDTQLRDWEAENPNAYAELMDFLQECVRIGKDIDAAKYLIDRLKGKPKQSIDANVTGHVIGLTLKDMELLQAMNRKEEIELTGKSTVIVTTPEPSSTDKKEGHTEPIVPRLS